MDKHTKLIAACGLYCANCKRYKKDKCPGCVKNDKATWCKIRSCCANKGITNCSACEEFIYPMDCKKYNTFIAKAIEFFSGTDRSMCIEYLRKHSPDDFITLMNETGKMSMPKVRAKPRKS